MSLLSSIRDLFRTETVRIHPDSIRQLSASRAVYRPKGVLTFEPTRISRHPELETPLQSFSIREVATGLPTENVLSPSDPLSRILVFQSCTISIAVISAAPPTPAFFGQVHVYIGRPRIPGGWEQIAFLGTVPNVANIYSFGTKGLPLVLKEGDEIIVNGAGGGETYSCTIYYYEIERG